MFIITLNFSGSLFLIFVQCVTDAMLVIAKTTTNIPLSSFLQKCHLEEQEEGGDKEVQDTAMASTL